MMELEGVDVKVEECEEQPALDLSKTKVIMEAVGVMPDAAKEEEMKTEPKIEVVDEDEEDEAVRRSRPADTTTASLQGRCKTWQTIFIFPALWSRLFANEFDSRAS